MGIFNKVYKKPVQLKELLNEQSLSENKKEELKGGILKEDKSKERPTESFDRLLFTFFFRQKLQRILFAKRI